MLDQPQKGRDQSGPPCQTGHCPCRSHRQFASALHAVCPLPLALIVMTAMLVILFALHLILWLPGETIQGNWLNPNGSVIINIAPCGDALCGRVVWASEKAQQDARKGGTNTLVGTELLSGFLPEKEGTGWSGKVFVPDIKKRSRAEIHQVTPDQLKVTGCAVGRLLCKSQTWTRTTLQPQ